MQHMILRNSVPILLLIHFGTPCTRYEHGKIIINIKKIGLNNMKVKRVGTLGLCKWIWRKHAETREAYMYHNDCNSTSSLFRQVFIPFARYFFVDIKGFPVRYVFLYMWFNLTKLELMQEKSFCFKFYDVLLMKL